MAHVLVTLKKSKHPTQPWSFTIDKPGPTSKETKRERYTRKSTAKRGALRQLHASKNFIGNWGCVIGGKWNPIKFA